jgi:succinyl-diaminopimelate desuccinylase
VKSEDIQRETLALTARLVACRSVTPDDGGALDIIGARLAPLGFVCERLDRQGVRNLWARHGRSAPLVCLAGHVDVVPPGPLDRWTSDPFTATERGGFLYGRGVADMKASVAAMVTAAERVVRRRGAQSGSVAVLLTSDEEGDAEHGTVVVADVLKSRQETIDACILGEPTSSERFGDTLKNGRRGSLNGTIRVKGVQCHIAYPERGRNPIQDAVPALAELTATTWDRGNEYFQPTSFQISNVHAGAGATNVIPGELVVQFNFRFSSEWTADRLKTRVREVFDRHRVDYEVEWHLSGQPFMTPKGALSDAVRAAVLAVTGVAPELSTGGGTSDGRFLAAVCREIVEFGPINESIHKIDEHVAINDLGPLSAIYERAVLMLLDGATRHEP